MKESGINYFIDQIGLNTGDLKVFYTFEDGAGSTVSSVANGDSQYAGTLSSVGTFWSKPGSGTFAGNSIAIGNASGLASATFTHLFSFEKIAATGGILFSCANGSSGYSIGLTQSNKLYFEAYNEQPLVSASLTNLSSKNLVSVGYVNNAVTFGYYNWNAQSFETETYVQPFGTLRSDTWTLGRSFTGFMDYYLYFGAFYSPSTQSQIASGFYNVPTGSGYSVQTVCVPAITGYRSVGFTITGITGYGLVNTPGGLGQFEQAFPATTSVAALTGIISTGVIQSGVTGLQCVTYTGASTVLLATNAGYASGFGMEKVIVLRSVPTGYILKYSNSRLFNPTFNLQPNYLIAGFDMVQTYDSGQVVLFDNGLMVENTGFQLPSHFLRVSGADNTHVIMYDLFSGQKLNLFNTSFTFTGQELYLNGLNLVSGLDFTVAGTTVTLSAANAALNGMLLVSPIGLSYTTGNYQVLNVNRFARDTSNLYVNGLRQQPGVDYIEGARYDVLSGNLYDENGNSVTYDGNGEFWDT